jgi:hypothetical protein
MAREVPILLTHTEISNIVMSCFGPFTNDKPDMFLRTFSTYLLLKLASYTRSHPGVGGGGRKYYRNCMWILSEILNDNEGHRRLPPTGEKNGSRKCSTAYCDSRHTTNLSLMFVDPCIIVQFIKKNPTRCNNM